MAISRTVSRGQILEGDDAVGNTGNSGVLVQTISERAAEAMHSDVQSHYTVSVTDLAQKTKEKERSACGPWFVCFLISLGDRERHPTLLGRKVLLRATVDQHT